MSGALRLVDGQDRAVNQLCVRLAEIYFSILQRKVLTPAGATSLNDLAANILAFQAYYEVMAQPFQWKFTRADLAKLLQRLASKNRGQLPGAA